jgi:hypothetical protein
MCSLAILHLNSQRIYAGIAQSVLLDDRGSIPRVDFFLRHFFHTSGIRPAYPDDTGDSFLVGKAARLSSCPLTYTVKIKSAWSFASVPPYVFVVWCLIEQSDNFTYIL